VPADAALVQSHDLQTDESLLTGESVPVRKITSGRPAPSKDRRSSGDDLPYVFSGSMVVRRTGIGEVIAIGALSEIGKIGQSLSTLETEPPRLQVQTRRLVRGFATVGGAVSVLAVLLYGTLRGGWLDAVLAGIALGMSMLPEEFPVVLTVFMAMGAWRISRTRVLTRRAAAIETLGSATVLCTDKTGTLTENRMSIAELRLRNGEIFRPREASGAKMTESFRDLIEFGILASARDPFDPMEKAFYDLGREQLAETENLHDPEWKLVHAYGLAPGLLAMSHAWQAADGRQEFVIAAKGAPEAIADLCHIFAVHVPIAGLALLPPLFGLPILFGPMHIAFLEMVIDPVCSLVFEAEMEEDDVMRRPPRAPDEPLLSGPLIGWSVLQGTFAFVLVALIFIVAFRRGMPEEEVRALAFFTLVLTIVSLIFVNRSFGASLVTGLRRPNPALALVLVAVTTTLGLTLLWPFASGLFRFGPLHLDDLALTLGAGVLVLVFLELLKPLWRERLRS
jgi:magnesium-transporting ATPase (P-type)